MNKDKQQKTSTELALQLYPAITQELDNVENLSPTERAETMYLLMLLIAGPYNTSRVINSFQGC